MTSSDYNICKYCTLKLTDCLDEGITCHLCQTNVHVRCLQSGGTPGSLHGDLFFIFTCKECAGTEQFVRDKLSWLKVLVLVMYHLLYRSPGLGRKGYFHWRNHIAALIDKNWDNLFLKEVKRKKKWIGTIAGTLSHFSQFFFTSGTSVINEPAWWALTYPKLTPTVIANLYSAFTAEKQKFKLIKISITDQEIFRQVLHRTIRNEELLTTCHKEGQSTTNEHVSKKLANKRKSILPSMESTSKKLFKINKNAISSGELMSPLLMQTETDQRMKQVPNRLPIIKETSEDPPKLLDPLCHYNTSLNNLSKQKYALMRMRLMGNSTKQFILSPYTGIHLKPYIRRDSETFPTWLRLMTDIQLKCNEKHLKSYQLPSRASIDYTYIQPEHIPAVNSLCNHFFWPGIDLTECLQYPDFSCVALYKKLIIGFAFLVPNVSATENYISFILTRPGWRNVGIGKFMMYHLIQTSLGKDITLHVSINSPALFLYQKFGFKVESVVLGFYEKYIHNETNESKHAFFCRLER